MLTAQLLLIKQAAKVPLSTQFFRRILSNVGSKHAARGKKDLLKGPWSSGLMVQIPSNEGWSSHRGIPCSDSSGQIGTHC